MCCASTGPLRLGVSKRGKLGESSPVASAMFQLEEGMPDSVVCLIQQVSTLVTWPFARVFGATIDHCPRVGSRAANGRIGE